MAKPIASLKRIQINKANTMMVATVAISAFIVIFSLVASRALLIKRGFQGRLIKEKETAVTQLKANIDTVDELVIAYKAFTQTPENVVGGNPTGEGDQDGDNGKIVLDALPSKYDFPALATSLEKILNKQNQKIDSISGTDDEVAQSASQEGVVPAPVEIPFELASTGNTTSAKELLQLFESSIRPLKVSILDLSGDNSELKVLITAKTYYQPEKALNFQKKVVK